MKTLFRFQITLSPGHTDYPDLVSETEQTVPLCYFSRLKKPNPGYSNDVQKSKLVGEECSEQICTSSLCIALHH